MATTRPSTATRDFTLKWNRFRWAVRWSEQQGGDNPASFAGQKIECAAGCGGVHDLHANPFCIQILQKGGCRKLNFCATAEQNQFGTERQNSIEMGDLQGRKACAFPFFGPAVRVDQQVAGVFLTVYGNPVWAVAGDVGAADCVGGKFHGKTSGIGKRKPTGAGFICVRAMAAQICGQIIGFAL